MDDPKGDQEAVAEPFGGLFRAFLATYLGESDDRELGDVLPPVFAARALVIALPRCYPTRAEPTRAALIRFARRTLAPAPFDLKRLSVTFREGT